MAYQKADGAYRRRGSEHHRRFVPNPTVSNFSGYEPASSVEGSFSYPCQDRLAERHFSDPHALSTASYSTAASSGSQPLLVGRETFQEHEGASWNDRFFQEPPVPLRRQGSYSQETSREPHNSSFSNQISYGGGGQTWDPPPSRFDFREQLSSNPVGSQVAFHSDRGPSEWGNSQFFQGGNSHKPAKRMPLMQSVKLLEESGRQFEGGSIHFSDPVPKTSITDFAKWSTRSRNSSSEFRPFPGSSSGMREYDDCPNVSSMEWQNTSRKDGRREWQTFDTPVQRHQIGNDAWQCRQMGYSPSSGACYASQRRFRGENPTGFSEPSSRDSSLDQHGVSSGHRGSLLGHYSETSGRNPLLGQCPTHYSGSSSQEALSVQFSGTSDVGRSRRRSDSFDKSEQIFKAKRGRGRRHPNPQPRRRESLHMEQSAFLGQGNVATLRNPQIEATSHSISKHVPRSRRSSKSDWALQPKITAEPRDWDYEGRSTDVRTKARKAIKGRVPLLGKSGYMGQVFTRRSLHAPSQSLEFGDIVKNRPPSPKTIQERLGPHIPGSGSVQNRLGPPKGRVGAHSCLRPENNSDAPLEGMHSHLTPGENLGAPLTSSSIHSRLGPGEDLSGPLASASIHSRLGPAENLSGPLSSTYSRLGPRENLGSPLGSDNIHSRLGPGENHASSLGSDDIHSHLGQGENHGTCSSLGSENIHSHLRLEENRGGSLGSDSIHSRLGPEDLGGSFASDSIHSHLGPGETFGDPHSLGPDEKLSGPLGSDHIYSRLGPEENLSVEGVHSRLGPEISSQSPHVKTEPNCSPDPFLDFAGSSQKCTPNLEGESRQRSHYSTEIQARSSFCTPDLPSPISGSPLFSGRKSPRPDSLPAEYSSPLHLHSDTTATSQRQSPTLYLSGKLPASQRPLDLNLLSNKAFVHASSKNGSPVQQGRDTSPQHPTSYHGSELLVKSKGTNTSGSVPREPASSPLDSPTNTSNKTKLESKRTTLTVCGQDDSTPLQKKSSSKSSSRGLPRQKSSKQASPTVQSPLEESISLRLDTKHSSTTTSAAPSQPKVTKKALDSNENSEREPTAVAKPQGQSSPTLLQHISVPSSTVQKSSRIKYPSKPKAVEKPEILSSSPTPTSGKVVSYTESAIVVTHADQTTISKDCSEKKSSQQKEEVCKAEPAVVSIHVDVEQRQSEDIEVDPSQLKVGVASVVTFESEMEEGEMTDSECEDLVIDLDRSSSSVPTPKKSQQLETSKSSSSKEVETSKCNSDLQTKIGTSSVEQNLSSGVASQKQSGVGYSSGSITSGLSHESSKEQPSVSAGVTGATSSDHHETKAVESCRESHQMTKAVNDIPNDHQQTTTVIIPKDHQETKVVDDSPRDHQKTNTTVEEQPRLIKHLPKMVPHGEMRQVSSGTDMKTVSYDTSRISLLSSQAGPTDSGGTTTASSDSESTAFADSKGVESFKIVTSQRSKLVKKAAVVLGFPLAKALNTATADHGGPSLLLMIRNDSAKRSNILKGLFIHKNERRLNVHIDVAFAYVQMRFPECAVGTAGITKLARLMAADSSVLFHCDLYSFYCYCDNDISKWRHLTKKFCEGSKEIMTYTLLRTFFPESVFITTGEFLSTVVRRLITKQCSKNMSYMDMQASYPEMSFLEEAKLKYGSSLVQVLDTIHQKICKVFKKDIDTCYIVDSHIMASSGENNGVPSVRPKPLSPPLQHNLPSSHSRRLSTPTCSTGAKTQPGSDYAGKPVSYMHVTRIQPLTPPAHGTHPFSPTPQQPSFGASGNGVTQTPGGASSLSSSVPLSSTHIPAMRITELSSISSPRSESRLLNPPHCAAESAPNNTSTLDSRYRPDASDLNSSQPIMSSAMSATVSNISSHTSTVASQQKKFISTKAETYPSSPTMRSPSSVTTEAKPGAPSAVLTGNQSLTAIQGSGVTETLSVACVSPPEEVAKTSTHQSEFFPEMSCPTKVACMATPGALKASLSTKSANETGPQPQTHASEVLHHKGLQSEQKESFQLKSTSVSRDKCKNSSDNTATTIERISSCDSVGREAGVVGLDASGCVLEADNVSVENASISSGEIISSSPSPPGFHSNLTRLYEEGLPHEDAEESRGHFSRGSSGWTSHQYLPPSPPRCRDLAQSYNYWRSHSPPTGNRWREEREQKDKPRGSHRDSLSERRRQSRSKSRSTSPLSERCRLSRRRRRISSPEDDSSRRRRTRSSLSPDVDSRKFGLAYKKWSRQRRGTISGDGKKGWRGAKRVRTSRSCDRHSDRETGGQESSDEDLEVLELRKEALISMLKDASKDKKEVKEEEAVVGKRNSTHATSKPEVEVESQDNQSSQSKSDLKNSATEATVEEQKVDMTVATDQAGSAEEVSDGVKVVEKTELSEKLLEQVPSSKDEVSVAGTEDIKEVIGSVEREGREDKVVETAGVGDEHPVLSPLAISSISVEEPSSDTLSAESGKLLPQLSPRSQTPSPRPSPLLQIPSVSSATCTASPQVKQPPPLAKMVSKSTAAPGAHGKSKAVAPSKKVVSLVAKQTAVLKATSLPSSGSGSRVSSPASSRGSPAPPLSGSELSASGTETANAVRRGSSINRTSTNPPTSVKVVPSSKVTWEIPEFHIQLAESESEEEQVESESEIETSGEGVKVAHRPPTVDEIDSVLGLFRRDAEARAKQAIVRSPSPLREGEPLQSSLEIECVDLAKPEAVGMLPLEQQREYLELKKRLVLHEKRQREEAMAEKSKEKGKQPLNSTSSKKMKIICSEQAKVVENQTSTATSIIRSEQVKQVENQPSTTAVRQDNMDHERELQVQQRETAEQKKIDEERKRREEEQKRKVEEKQRKREEERKRVEEERKKRQEEEERRKLEREEKVQKERKRREMKVAELEGKIRSCRSQTELWTKALTSLTHEMAECESEMEEHELKIELLRKQLDLARSGRDQCKQQRLELQNKVRDAQEHISRHTTMVQETQSLLINERDLLITMENNHGDSTSMETVSVEIEKDVLITVENNHGDSTDMETVSMEIESDGSKGEGDMEMVTSSGESVCEGGSVQECRHDLTPLKYEAISDAEGPGLNSVSVSGTEFGSTILVPDSDSTMATSPGNSSTGRGKKRRLSRSQRTRKSSLSVCHTAVGWASDSEIEESGKLAGKFPKLRKRDGKFASPPIPTSPPPSPPPPPPLPPPPRSSNVPTNSSLIASKPATTIPLASVPTLVTPTVEIMTEVDNESENVSSKVCVHVNNVEVEGEEGVMEEQKHTAAVETGKEGTTENKPTSELALTATLPLPPLEVEFITDTDTDSEDGFPLVNRSTPVVKPVNLSTPAAKPEKSSQVEEVPSMNTICSSGKAPVPTCTPSKPEESSQVEELPGRSSVATPAPKPEESGQVEELPGRSTTYSNDTCKSRAAAVATPATKTEESSQVEELPSTVATPAAKPEELPTKSFDEVLSSTSPATKMEESSQVEELPGRSTTYSNDTCKSPAAAVATPATKTEESSRVEELPTTVATLAVKPEELPTKSFDEVLSSTTSTTPAPKPEESSQVEELPDRSITCSNDTGKSCAGTVATPATKTGESGRVEELPTTVATPAAKPEELPTKSFDEVLSSTTSTTPAEESSQVEELPGRSITYSNDTCKSLAGTVATPATKTEESSHVEELPTKNDEVLSATTSTTPEAKTEQVSKVIKEDDSGDNLTVSELPCKNFIYIDDQPIAASSENGSQVETEPLRNTCSNNDLSVATCTLAAPENNTESCIQAAPETKAENKTKNCDQVPTEVSHVDTVEGGNGSALSCNSDLSVACNPFISMLKISKIESLSNSPEASNLFSPTEMEVDPGQSCITDDGDHMTFPAHHVILSQDSEEISHNSDETPAQALLLPSPQECSEPPSKVQKSSLEFQTPSLESNSSVPCAVEQGAEQEQSPRHCDSVHTLSWKANVSKESKKMVPTAVEKHIHTVYVTVGDARCQSKKMVPTAVEKHIHTVYVTVGDASEHSAMAVSKGGKKTADGKKRQRVVKKQENVLRKRVGDNGKVKKPERKKVVGKLPLAKSGSDSEVVATIRKNKRKSTPRRYAPKTAPPSPAQKPALKTSISLSLGAPSPTLIKALQTTLESALSPALASVLSPSTSCREFTDLHLRREGRTPCSLSTPLNETLKHTLNSALSPVLESVLSPSSYCKLLGSTPAAKPSCESESEAFSFEFEPRVASIGKSHDLEIKSHDSAKVSHDTVTTSLPQSVVRVSDPMEVDEAGTPNKNDANKCYASLLPPATNAEAAPMTCTIGSNPVFSQSVTFPSILPLRSCEGVAVSPSTSFVFTKLPPSSAAPALTLSPLTSQRTAKVDQRTAKVDQKTTKVDHLLSQTLHNLTTSLIKSSSHHSQSPPSVESVSPSLAANEAESHTHQTTPHSKEDTQESSSNVTPRESETHQTASSSDCSQRGSSSNFTAKMSCCLGGGEASFLCGPVTPVLGVLPRNVPDIPFEVASACLDVQTLPSLVCARFASVSSACEGEVSLVTEEQSFDSMETCDVEDAGTLGNDCLEVNQSTSLEGGEEGAKNDIMETSQDESINTQLKGSSNQDTCSNTCSKTSAITTRPDLKPQTLPPPGGITKTMLSSNQQSSVSTQTVWPKAGTKTASPLIGAIPACKTVVTVSGPVVVKPSIALKSLVGTKPSGSSISRVTTSSKAKSKSVVLTTPVSCATPAEYSSKKTAVSKCTSKAVPVIPATSSVSSHKSLLVEGLLGRIQQVKANLEKQGQVTQTNARISPSTTRLLTAVQPVDPRAQTADAAKKLGTSVKVAQSDKLQRHLEATAPRAQPAKKEVMKTAVPGSDRQLKSHPRSPQRKAGEQLVKAAASSEGTARIDSEDQGPSSNQGSFDGEQMDNVVKQLGFTTSWKELQNSLQPSSLTSEATGQYHTTIVGNPLLINNLNENSSGLVSESVLESLEKQNVQAVGELVVKKSTRSLRRYQPYSSPLLFFRSYRLSPHYRTNEKLSLSSLSHSNKIDPMKIMCKFDVFGKCADPLCTGQHLRDIKLSKAELVDDIIAYSPSLSTVTVNTTSTQKKTTQTTPTKPSSKKLSYAETLLSSFSGKMSDEQLLLLAAHRVSESRAGREGESVVTAEETRYRARDGGVNKGERDKATRPPPLYWGTTTEGRGLAHREDPTCLPDSRHLPTSTTVERNEKSSKADRYFTPSSPTPSTSPSGPTHFLSLARGATERKEACDILESGLALHNDSEVTKELWVDYLQTKHPVLSASGRHEDLEELLTKALSTCPTYAVIMKCVELAESVAGKECWISRGYLAITSQPQSTPSLSLCCVELLLSHAYLHCLSGCLDKAVSTLKHSLQTSEITTTTKDHLFKDITSHLSLPHLQLAYLSLLYFLYTSAFPNQLLLSPHTAYPPVKLRHNVESLLVPWSPRHSLSSSKLQKIEQLLAVAITRCQCQDPTNSMETTFALYHNLILFQLTHRSREIAQQTLNGLLNCSPHSTQLWLLAAQLQDWTTSSALALDVLQKAKESELDSGVPELYCYAVKLVMKQVVDGDVLAAALPWLRGCVCQFYDISESDKLQLHPPDVALLYRKLLGQMVPYDYYTPEPVNGDGAKKNLPYLWIAYCLLVQLSYHTVRGDYYHSSPEEAFESAIHSVNRPSDLRIVWLEYLSYLREKAVENRNSQSAFKAFSDCVYRCLVVMGEQATPTPVPGQPTHYHDFSFQEQVCDLYFSCLSPSSTFTLSSLQKLVRKFPDDPHLIARFSRHCLLHSPSSLEMAQATLAGFLSANPKCLSMWRLAIQVELAQKNIREARWMFREAVMCVPLSADLWKEFLLFELGELSHSPRPSIPSSLSLTQDVIHGASQQGVVLTSRTLPSSVSPCHSSPARLHT